MALNDLQRALVTKLADGQFHSGTALAKELSVSRTGIWALVHALRDLGLDVKSLPGRGYRLARPVELLEREAIVSRLDEPTRSALSGIELHDCIDSTNTRLGALARQGAARGTVCLAETQTGGRGRMGRGWLSPFAGNICLSALWHFDASSTLDGLSLAVGVGVVRALRGLGINETSLKWPNDILWDDRKLAGILLEVFGEAHGRHCVVIGIGMNVCVPRGIGSAIDQSWTDLSAVTRGVPPSRNALIAAILNELFSLLLRYPESGFEAYRDEWNRLHCMKGRMAVLQQGGRSVRGKVLGVDAQGLLRLMLDDGHEHVFASGDVRVRADEG